MLVSYAAAARSQPLPSAGNGNALSQTFLRVHRALVLVEATETGTGFVVSSVPQKTTNATTHATTHSYRSYILTASHVVAKIDDLGFERCVPNAPVNIYLHDDYSDSGRLSGSVAKCQQADPGMGRPLDLALVAVDGPPLQPLYIALEAPEGTQVAVTGYPITSNVALQTTGELRPTVHEGIISAVRLQGESIEHSAVTDFGNSGGPLFDVNSGYVVGVVEGKALKSAGGAYIAIGYAAIRPFLNDAGIPLPTERDVDAFGPARVPGHSTLLFVSAANPDSKLRAAIAAADRRLQAGLAGVWGTDLRFLSVPPAGIPEYLVQGTTPVDLDQRCWDTAVGAIYFNPGIEARHGRWSLDPDVALLDCWGNTLRAFRLATPILGTGSFGDRSFQRAFTDAIDRAVLEFRTQMRSEQSRFRNLLDYGVFIADGETISGFDFCVRREQRDASGRMPGCDASLTVDGQTNLAVARFVNRGGPAWLAGLRPYDVVETINGHAAKQHSAEMLELEEASYWRLGVLRPGSDKPVDVCFHLEGLDWYLQQRHAVSSNVVTSCEPDSVTAARRATSNRALTQPDVDYDPVLIKGEATLDADEMIVRMPLQFESSSSYTVTAYDKTTNEPVTVIGKRAGEFTLHGKKGEVVDWIAVGTLSTQHGITSAPSP